MRAYMSVAGLLLSCALLACGGGGSSAAASAPAPIAVDVSSVSINDPGSALPINWQTSGAFMEIYVRGYKDSNGDGIGDMQGLIQQLPYLKDLGIKGIWLMPINQSQDHDHGYAVTDYRATETAYGTLADFDALIQAAHAQGIAVIMDYVINHSAYANPLFNNSRNSASSFRNWYIWSATKPTGWSIYGSDPWHSSDNAYYFAGFWDQMPDFNLRNSAVLNYHHDSMRFWLNRGVDGFRFDAVGNLVENGPAQWEAQPENYTIMGNVSALLGQYQQKYMVCEAPRDPVGFAAGSACGSAFAFGHNYDLINAARGNAGAIQAVATYPTQVPATMATFLANHDGFAGRRVFDQFSGDRKAYKLAAATYLLQPGIPFIYYGEEIGMAGGQGLSGDWELRAPMSWTGNGSNAGFTSGTPFRALSTNVGTANVATESGDPNSIYAFYKAILNLRNGHAALARGSYDYNSVQGSTLSFQRNLNSDHVLVLLNYGTAPAVISVANLPANASLVALYPSGGAALPASDAGGLASFSLAAQSLIVVQIN